jgi:hypothetical protein
MFTGVTGATELLARILRCQEQTAKTRAAEYAEPAKPLVWPEGINPYKGAVAHVIDDLMTNGGQGAIEVIANGDKTHPFYPAIQYLVALHGAQGGASIQACRMLPERFDKLASVAVPHDLPAVVAAVLRNVYEAGRRYTGPTRGITPLIEKP